MSLAIEITKPGVTAIVNQGQVSRPLERQPTSTAFVIGFASWGQPKVPQTITSWSEFRRVFGGFHPITYLADFAYIFFNHFGGKQMIVSRAVLGSSVKATATRNNRAGTPVPTFKFDAKYPSSNVDISVTTTDGITDTTNLTVVSQHLGITEKFENVNLRDPATLSKINATSKLIDISLIAATVTGTNGLPFSGLFSLTGGNDNHQDYGATDMDQFLSEFEDEMLGAGQVCIPGFSADSSAALVAHAEAFNRLALIEPAIGNSYSNATPQAVLGTLSSYAAVYYPWVQMNAVDGSGDKKFYPPTIFAAGACAQVDRTIGTHKAPANITIPIALDVERNSDGTSVINDSVREFLNGKNTNVIAPIAGEGIKIYGARVCHPAGETRVRFVHERRMLNLIYYTAKVGYAWAVFSIVDAAGRLFRDLRSSGKTFLRNLWKAGALYGKTEDEAFIVTADESNNPAEELEAGKVHVQLGVKLSPTAEMVIINIDNVPLSQNLNVLNGGNQ